MAELRPEDKTLEYKKGGGTLPKEFWPTYSAFANTSGGTVIFGISEEKNHEYTITGVNNPELYKETILNEMNNPQKVSCGLINESHITQEEIDGKIILKVTVIEAPYNKKPVYINDRINSSYKRVHAADQLLSIEEIKFFFNNAQEITDSKLLSGFSIEDININDLHRYRETIESIEPSYESISDIDFLISIGAFRKDRETNKVLPTLGGLLFFGHYNSIIEILPNFQLDYFKRKYSSDQKWDDRVSSGDMHFPDINLFSFYNIVSEKLFQTVEDRFVQDKQMRRTSYLTDVRAALREVLVNTLMHAYYGEDTNIKITAYEKFYDFQNPGKMRISKEDFLLGGNSKPRNSIIATLFRRIGLAEKAGFGGYKIMKVAQENSLKTPDIIIDDFSTSVHLWKVDYMETLPPLSDNANKVFSFLYDAQLAKRKAIKDKTELSDHFLKNAINELKDLGLIVQHGERKSTFYTLNLPDEMRTSRSQRMLNNIERSLRKK